MECTANVIKTSFPPKLGVGGALSLLPVSCLTAALEVPSPGQLGPPGLPPHGLVQVGDEELAQLHPGTGDHGLDQQVLAGEDGGGVWKTRVVEYRVCPIESRPDILLLAIVVSSESERVDLERRK